MSETLSKLLSLAERTNFISTIAHLNENQDLRNGKPIHVMIDIETLALDDNAAVFSFGYALFNKDGVTYSGKLIMNPDKSTGTVDQNTVDWHNKTPVLKANLHEAYDSLKNEEEFCLEIKDLLTSLWTHAGEDKADFKTTRGQKIPQLWAMGPQFDFVILKNMFRRNNIEWPVVFYAERDLRTVLELVRDSTDIDLRKFIHNPVLHDAEQDAVAQAHMATFAVASEILSQGLMAPTALSELVVQNNRNVRYEWFKETWRLPEDYVDKLWEIYAENKNANRYYLDSVLPAHFKTKVDKQDFESVMELVSSGPVSMHHLRPLIRIVMEQKPD